MVGVGGCHCRRRRRRCIKYDYYCFVIRFDRIGCCCFFLLFSLEIYDLLCGSVRAASKRARMRMCVSFSKHAFV